MTGQLQLAYKVLTAEQRDALEQEGVFHGTPVDLDDGFIHLSTTEQLPETLDKHFGGQSGLMLAVVDLAALANSIRWEPARGGQLFPHIYGVLPMSAVVAIAPVEREADGSLRLPEPDSA